MKKLFLVDIKRLLQNKNVRVEVDLRNEKIGYKIREAQMEKIPYMLVIGDKEMESKAVAVRSRKEGDLGAMPIDQFMNNLTNEIETKAR
jgi:threonyl-tRNA synthetase